MSKKKLEKDLYNLYSNINIESNQNDINELINKATEIIDERNYNKLTFIQFYVEQIRFIRKKVWIIQFIILLLCGIRLYSSNEIMIEVNLISSITPLIFLSGITELSRSYTYKSLEIELSTKYTFQQIMMSRISILGFINILSITILILMINTYSSIELYHVFVYMCVPFMLTCFLSLYLLNKFKNKDCNYYCFSAGVLIMLLVYMSSIFSPNLYKASLIHLWNIMLLISVLGVITQIYSLMKNCENNDTHLNYI